METLALDLHHEYGININNHLHAVDAYQAWIFIDELVQELMQQLTAVTFEEDLPAIVGCNSCKWGLNRTHYFDAMPERIIGLNQDMAGISQCTGVSIDKVFIPPGYDNLNHS